MVKVQAFKLSGDKKKTNTKINPRRHIGEEEVKNDMSRE